MTDTQRDRRNPNQYQCKHEAEIGKLSIGYDMIAKNMDNLIIKFDIVLGQMNKVVLMEERNEANMRDLAKLTAKIESFEANIYQTFNSHVAQMNTKMDTIVEKLDDRIDHVETVANDKLTRLEEKLTDRLDSTREKLYSALKANSETTDKLDRIVHKWIYWGGGAWAVFAGLVYLFGTMPIDALKSEWNKMQNKISASEMIVSGKERRLDRLETKK